MAPEGAARHLINSEFTFKWLSCIVGNADTSNRRTHGIKRGIFLVLLYTFLITPFKTVHDGSNGVTGVRCEAVPVDCFSNPGNSPEAIYQITHTIHKTLHTDFLKFFFSQM